MKFGVQHTTILIIDQSASYYLSLFTVICDEENQQILPFSHTGLVTCFKAMSAVLHEKTTEMLYYITAQTDPNGVKLLTHWQPRAKYPAPHTHLRKLFSSEIMRNQHCWSVLFINVWCSCLAKCFWPIANRSVKSVFIYWLTVLSWDIVSLSSVQIAGSCSSGWGGNVRDGVCCVVVFYAGHQ